MSLSIWDLRLQVKDRSVLNKRTVTSYRRVSESELVGLVVELLKQRGAEMATRGEDWWHFDNLKLPPPGRYLVVPLDALEESDDHSNCYSPASCVHAQREMG